MVWRMHKYIHCLMNKKKIIHVYHISRHIIQSKDAMRLTKICLSSSYRVKHKKTNKSILVLFGPQSRYLLSVAFSRSSVQVTRHKCARQQVGHILCRGSTGPMALGRVGIASISPSSLRIDQVVSCVCLGLPPRPPQLVPEEKTERRVGPSHAQSAQWATTTVAVCRIMLLRLDSCPGGSL